MRQMAGLGEFTKLADARSNLYGGVMDESVLTLPWQIQIALGSGYAAYMLAYAGIRDHHKGTDIAFRAIAFGLIATAAFALIPEYRVVLRLSLAIGATLIGGVLWRLVGINLTRGFLRWTNVSWADDTPSAWTTIGAENSARTLSQASVLLDDGTWLNCSDMTKFVDSPFGPCVLGLNGDIALYVTDEVNPDGTVEENNSVLDKEYGDRITYVPAARIIRVALRYK